MSSAARFSDYYVMEMTGQHCGSGRTRTWGTNYLPVRQITSPLSFSNYLSAYPGSNLCLRLVKSEVSHSFI